MTSLPCFLPCSPLIFLRLSSLRRELQINLWAVNGKAKLCLTRPSSEQTLSQLRSPLQQEPLGLLTRQSFQLISHRLQLPGSFSYRQILRLTLTRLGERSSQRTLKTVGHPLVSLSAVKRRISYRQPPVNAGSPVQRAGRAVAYQSTKVGV